MRNYSIKDLPVGATVKIFNSFVSKQVDFVFSHDDYIERRTGNRNTS